MRKEVGAKAKDMAPKLAKPAVLSAEAAAMELKLADLRKAMEKERAKREALMANMGGGSIWRNGGTQGGLKPNAKGAGGASGASSSRRPASGDATPSGGHPSHSPGVASTSGSAPAPQRSSSARAGASSSGGGEAMPLVSGSRLTAPRPAAVSGSGSGSGASKSKADVLDLQGGGGMSCGTDGGPSLASGAFNEADSHRSFLEALNEWRKANRGDAAAEAGANHGTTSSGTDAGRPRSAAAVASSSLEVQTETRPVASRPSSAKPLSYFDKLVINTNSRQAGHLAAGEPPETLRRSISAQSSGVFRPSSATLKDKPPGTPTTAAAGAAAASPPPSKPLSTAKAGAKAGAAAPAPAASAPAAKEPSGGGDQQSSNPADPLSILDRLEALERQRQAAAEDDDDEAEGGAISVTTAQGMVLTKGVRLPDEVLLPQAEAC